MTPNFNELCEDLIFEQKVTFAQLPDNPGGFYGFWLSADGELYLVKDEFSHMKESKKIVLGSNYLTNKFFEMNQIPRSPETDKEKLRDTHPSYFEDVLFGLHWLRVAREMQPQRAIYFSGSIHTKPNAKQINTLKDLGLLYDMSVIDDDGKYIYRGDNV